MITILVGLLIAFCVGFVVGRWGESAHNSNCICGHGQCYHLANVSECYARTPSGTCRYCSFTPSERNP